MFIRYGDVDFYVVVLDVLIPAAMAFQPEVILVSVGFDALAGDPIGQCSMTPRCLGFVTRQLVRLARRIAESRIAVVLESGYDSILLSNCVEECLKQLVITDDELSKKDGGPIHIERLRSQFSLYIVWD